MSPAPELVIRPLFPELTRLGVKRLGVFGSMIRGDATDQSDIDILVELDPQRHTFDTLFEIGDVLEAAFHRHVDLVTFDALSPYLGPLILREIRYVDLNR